MSPSDQANPQEFSREHHPIASAYDEQSIQCPECGAPVEFRGTAVSAVCEYCSSTVVRSGVNVELIGKVSALVDNGSPILLHSRGTLVDLPFTVAGRLQVQYARGTWNEWFLEFADGTIGWLADAQNQFAVVKPIDPNQVAGRLPAFDELSPGRPLRVAGRMVVVVDRRGAAYQGAEGLLPFRAEPGMTFYSVDLRGYAEEFVTLDWGNDPRHDQPLPYVGFAVSLADLRLHPLRRFQGWPPPAPPSPAAAGGAA